ncbi:MAG: ECF-type riboflavin transporter substrate-binding protein [Erysipelotrichaceae bacterium]
MKKSVISTKAIVAAAIGAALFALAFMFIKVPSPIPATQIQTAYGIGAFFAALFGPIVGFLIAFIGHAVNDIALFGSAWWSWIIASGISGLIIGLSFNKFDIENGVFGKKDIIIFNVYQVVAHLIAWLVIAPVLDIVIYAEPAAYVFTQGVFAAISNAVVTGIIGTLLLLAYSKTRTAKGSLKKK